MRRRISRPWQYLSGAPSAPYGVTGTAATVARTSRSSSVTAGSMLIGTPFGCGRHSSAGRHREMPVRETGDVRAEQGRRLGGRTASCRGQDGLMLSRLLLPRRGLLPGQRGHQRGLIAQVVQGLDQQAVAAGQVQGAVKLAVGQAALRLVGGGVRGR